MTDPELIEEALAWADTIAATYEDPLQSDAGVLAAALRQAQEREAWVLAVVERYRTLHSQVCDDYWTDDECGCGGRQLIAALAVSPPEVNYTGPDPSVECAYPPCNNRLRRSDAGGDQWCSKEHRALSVSPPADEAKR